LNYFGIDSSSKLIAIGKKYMVNYGLSSKKLVNMRLEDVSQKFDHIVCINVLTYLDNIYKYLERMINLSNKSIIIRESFHTRDIYKYVPDNYLDKDKKINTYINTYSIKKISLFLKNFNCDFKLIKDQYTKGKVQKVIGHNHYWKFLKIIKK
jgi:cyclopropane fatty-acyl-phospholipid synthase-like methyltransferase